MSTSSQPIVGQVGTFRSDKTCEQNNVYILIIALSPLAIA